MLVMQDSTVLDIAHETQYSNGLLLVKFSS